MDDLKRIEMILKQLFAAYPNSQATIETTAVYYRLLRDIPADALQTIADQCVAEMKFLPTVAELREMYHALTKRSGELAAAEAWGMVTQELRRVGSWGTPTFDNPVVAAVVKQMGWRELCMSENPAVDRAQFMRMYDQMIARESGEQRLLPQAKNLIASINGKLLTRGEA